MNSIIVPVNFTDNSNYAARYAADLAAAIGADLHLVHVLDLPDTPIGVPIPDYALDEMRNSCFSSLESLSAELIRQTGGKISIGTDLETGDVESGIKAFCQWKNPFLMVMGLSPNLSLRPLPFPVLLVPGQPVFHPIRKIVLACDQHEIGTGIPGRVVFLNTLRDLFGAQFDIVHISTPEEVKEKRSMKAFNAWKENFLPSHPEMHFISAATVEEGVREYLDTHNADWVMVFPKKNDLFHLHKSLSKDIVLHCPLPIMSLHE